jgi:crotonobetainyl-CoA hydratase
LTQLLDSVLLITLNRPTAGNSINADLGRGLEDALHQLDTDPQIRVAVLTGAGQKMFCAGADLKALAAGESLSPDRDRNRGVAALFRREVRKPIIAAVNGVALGGGTEMALACDLVIAADTAVFGLPEVTRGLPAGGERAMELLLVGNRIDAATAQRFGLVNRVVPLSQVQREALDMAEQIAANAPLAVQANKRIALEGLGFGVVYHPALWEWHDGVARDVLRSLDAREGPRAFAEHRPPRWTGS